VFARWRADNSTSRLLDEVSGKFAANHEELMHIATAHYGKLFGVGSFAYDQCTEMLGALGAAYEGTETGRHREKRAMAMFQPVPVPLALHSVLCSQCYARSAMLSVLCA
jgi:hypothetical protein